MLAVVAAELPIVLVISLTGMSVQREPPYAEDRLLFKETKFGDLQLHTHAHCERSLSSGPTGLLPQGLVAGEGSVRISDISRSRSCMLVILVAAIVSSAPQQEACTLQQRVL